ncbi:MAG: helix-turn-helix domain-containing protein [Coriobacteriia bacterium]|nr:helix-turn-helix domain-containing protein [Coriobacteriia bacterium]
MITQKVGQRIRALRLERTDLSQEKFALKIGMDRTYFTSVEMGRRNISIVNLEKIARGLGITLEELFKGL